ncbi:thioredoxin reductase [Campylobacter showae]|uniref:thioredoxin reductase n=1 Tax=Campylobacter showae TaxID=204 RepID=UPI000F0981AD|nr:thioredoxin reductase [Campylobacter showae]
MKNGYKILISILVLGSVGYLAYTTIQKGIIMNNETYIVIAPNGMKIPFDKNTNLSVSELDHGADTQSIKEHSQMLLSARDILNSSPYKDYKPSYFNPNPNEYGQTEYLSFEPWYKLSFKPNSKEISPWTKKEKAYYESLKDKRDRYIYLVKRSNLKCSMLEIPDDAIARVDEKGRLTKPEYKDIYDTVERNKNTLKSNLFIGEWNICAGILGDVKAFGSGGVGGFKARKFQRAFLAAQLGEVKALKYLSDAFQYYTYNIGLNKNLSRSLEFQALYKNPPLDEYGMIPYLDEIVGSDFIMDFNRMGVAFDPEGTTHQFLRDEIEEGRLLDPRDIDANEKTREEFIKYLDNELPYFTNRFDKKGFPKEMTAKDISLYIDSTLLESKIMSLTPPEGYPNAPYYNTPEELKRMYESGKLDKRLNPLTPAMYKPSFPKDLKDKIEEYAKEHNIKD